MIVLLLLTKLELKILSKRFRKSNKGGRKKTRLKGLECKKKAPPLMAGPLRRGGVKAGPLRKKEKSSDGH